METTIPAAARISGSRTPFMLPETKVTPRIMAPTIDPT